MKKKIFLILRIVVGLGIILVLFRFISYKNLIHLYRSSIKSYLVLAFLVFIIINIIGAFRWRFILHSLGLIISIREALYVCFSSLFFNLFFPSLLGADLFRGVSLSYHHKNTYKVISSVVMDRFSGGFGLILVSLPAVILGRKYISQANIIIGITVFLIVSILIVSIVSNKSLFQYFNHCIKDGIFKSRLVKLYNELYFFRENPKIFFNSLIYSFTIQAATCLIFFIISRAFFLKLNIIYFFILIPIIQFIAILPVTIAGMGTRGAAIVYFFSIIGVDKSVALSISFVFLFFTIFTSLMGGIIYVMVYHRWLERNLPDS